MKRAGSKAAKLTQAASPSRMSSAIANPETGAQRMPQPAVMAGRDVSPSASRYLPHERERVGRAGPHARRT